MLSMPGFFGFGEETGGRFARGKPPSRSQKLIKVAEAYEGLLGDVNNETIGHANLKNRSERTESLKRK